MNTIQMKMSKTLNLLLLAMVFWGLADVRADDYFPSEDKLTQKAGRSKDLYVDPQFSFASHKAVNMELSLPKGEPSGTMVFVYRVDTDNEQDALQIPELTSLIGLFKADENGQVSSRIEIASDVNKLMFKTQVLGKDNHVFVDLVDQHSVSLAFK